MKVAFYQVLTVRSPELTERGGSGGNFKFCHFVTDARKMTLWLRKKILTPPGMRE
jgi:hypothetical protein